MKKVMAMVTLMAFLLQVLTFSVFAESSDAGGFRPTIDLSEGMVKTKMSEKEISKLYSEFKSKVENDRESQKKMITRNQQKEKSIIEETKKKYREEIEENTSGISQVLNSSTMLTPLLSTEIVNAPL